MQEEKKTKHFCNVKTLARTLKDEISVNGMCHVPEILKAYQFNLEEWQDYINFEEERYSRNLIVLEDTFSVMLLCWNKEQGTPVHTHSPNEDGVPQKCCFIVLDGNLELNFYKSFSSKSKTGEIKKTSILKTGSIHCFNGREGLHKLANKSKSKTALSLHVYCPTYLECCFNTTGKREAVPVVYRPGVSIDRQELQLCSQVHEMYTSLDSLAEMLRKELKHEKAAERTDETIIRISNILQSLRFNPREAESYAHWDKGHYTRNLVSYDEKFTILILCWEKGQMSPIHDHAEASCWVKLLKGVMRETKFVVGDDGSLEVSEVTNMEKEDVAYIDDRYGVHEMGNPVDDSVTMSIHIYSPPIKNCHVFTNNEKKQVSLVMANGAKNPFVEHSLRMSKPALNLKDFVHELCQMKKCDPTHIQNLLRDTEINEEEWKEYVHFSPNRFTRFLLAFNEMVSVMLICWYKGQKTPVHNHGDKRQVWFKVITGDLMQSFHNSDGGIDDTREIEYYNSSSGIIQQENASQFHIVGNASDEAEAISLHVYNPPYIDLHFEDEESGETKVIPAVYCSPPNSPVNTQVCPTFCKKSCVSKHRPRVFANFHLLTEELGRTISSQGCCDSEAITTVLSNFQIHPDEWKKYAVFNENHYTRILVAKDEHFTLNIICWFSNQKSVIHDHGGSKAWVKVLTGKLLECQYEEDVVSLEQKSERVLKADKAVFIDPSVIHQMSNQCEEGTVSLHLYCPPHTTCNCFTEEGVKTQVSVNEVFVVN